MIVQREKSSRNANSLRFPRVEKNRRFVLKGGAAKKETV